MIKANRHSPEAGFTLIEIMVAVAIMVIISLLLWQSTAVIMTAKMRYEVEDIRFQEALMALTRISDDLSMAYLYQSQEHLGVSGIGEKLALIQFIGKGGGEQDTLNFSSLSNLHYIKDRKESEQAEVSYFLRQTESEDEEHTGFDLVKRVQSPPDNEPEEGGVQYVVLENVKGLKFQYYDRDREEWRREWDSSSLDFNRKLPRAVVITLVVPDPIEPDLDRTFTTTALLEMAPGPNDF